MYKKCVCIKDISFHTYDFKVNTVYTYQTYYRHTRMLFRSFIHGGLEYIFIIDGIKHKGSLFSGTWEYIFNKHFMDLALFREQQIKEILE